MLGQDSKAPEAGGEFTDSNAHRDFRRPPQKHSRHQHSRPPTHQPPTQSATTETQSPTFRRPPQKHSRPPTHQNISHQHSNLRQGDTLLRRRRPVEAALFILQPTGTPEGAPLDGHACSRVSLFGRLLSCAGGDAVVLTDGTPLYRYARALLCRPFCYSRLARPPLLAHPRWWVS